MVVLNFLCVFVVLFNVVNCATDVAQCKGTAKAKPVMTEAFLGECVTPPCPFKRGEKTWINMTFTSDGDYTKVSNNIFATMMGVKHGYPGLHGVNACPYITPGCPMKNGETYKFAIELDVKKNFPKVTVTLHFAVKDEESGKDIGCFESPIKIV